MTKFKLTMLAAAAALLAFGVAAYAPANASNDTGHPFRGHAQVCLADAGKEPACTELNSDDTFNTLEECNATMASRLQDLADYVHRQNPTIDFTAQYICTPDETLFDS